MKILIELDSKNPDDLKILQNILDRDSKENEPDEKVGTALHIINEDKNIRTFRD
jgi:hypothetical protein